MLTDPAGGRVLVTQGLVDHMLADPQRQDGREAFFPLVRETVERPAEIWVGFGRDETSGRVTLRRRYVRVVDLGDRRTLGLVADAEGGLWSGVTFFRGEGLRDAHLRTGLRVYRRDEPEAGA